MRNSNMTIDKPTPNDEDSDPHALEDATDETAAEPDPPEVTEQTKELVAWDEPPGAAGHEVPPVQPADETSAAEQLVEEGIEEADRDRRIAAADPDFEA
jgi:hypothetical protein